MIWSDDLCKRVLDSMIEVPGISYGQMATRLSQELEEQIHPEQLRAALRRYNARMRVKDVVVEDAPALQVAERIVPRVVEPLRPIEHHAARANKPVRIRFGAVGDTHNGSKYEDLESLNKMYDIFADEGVSVVYHTGNYIDGEAPFNRNDLKVQGMDAQIRYFVDNYPRRDGIVTRFIAGDDHEGWYVQKHGIDIGQHTEDIARRMGRMDLEYLDYMEATVPIVLPDGDTLNMRVLHPGGGSSYALSHTSQKLVDAISEDELKPLIMLVGHYHKAEYLPNYRGVRIIQTGTFQRQTPFMRKKRLHADVGGWIVDVSVYDEHTIRVSAEFVHFMQRPWKHVMG